LAVTAISLACGTMVFAEESASQADRAFVAKVSQGALYEVEMGKIAAMRCTTPAVKLSVCWTRMKA
jgi:putative membrane protein